MTMLRASLRISPFLTPFLLVACGPGPTPPVQARPVESVTVAPATATLVIGDTVRLVATVRDSAGNVLRDRLVTNRQHEVSALHLCSIADALELQCLAEAGGDAGDHICDQRAGERVC